jgi:mono/diheme cytochrome c family protein
MLFVRRETGSDDDSRTRDERTMKRIAISLMMTGLAAALWAGRGVVAQSPSGDPIAGEALAREVCTTCHQVEKGQSGTSLQGAPAFQDVADDPAATSLALRVFLRNPHDVMPDLILSDTETEDVIAYILSLK